MKLKFANCAQTILRSVLLINMLFLSVAVVAQSSQSTPDDVVERYFELQVAMTPDNFRGDQAELEQLQTKLIHESMELLCQNGIPLMKNRVEVSTLISEGLIVLCTSSLTRITSEAEFSGIYGLYINGNLYVTVYEWAKFYYETYIQTVSYDYEYYLYYLTNIVARYNEAARASYEKYAKLNLMYNSQVGGVNIIDKAFFRDGSIAIVEAYISGGQFFGHQQVATNNDNSQYILLRKIADKWYIDNANVCYKNKLDGVGLELKGFIEEYNAIIAARPKKQEVSQPQVDTLPSPENFDNFLVRFYKEESFQKERVRFPIGRTYDMMMDTFAPYTPDTWKHISGYGVHKKSDTQRGGEWATDGGYSGGSILFELGGNNKWYLIEYNTY